MNGRPDICKGRVKIGRCYGCVLSCQNSIWERPLERDSISHGGGVLGWAGYRAMELRPQGRAQIEFGHERTSEPPPPTAHGSTCRVTIFSRPVPLEFS